MCAFQLNILFPTTRTFLPKGHTHRVLCKNRTSDGNVDRVIYFRYSFNVSIYFHLRPWCIASLTNDKFISHLSIVSNEYVFKLRNYRFSHLRFGQIGSSVHRFEITIYWRQRIARKRSKIFLMDKFNGFSSSCLRNGNIKSSIANEEISIMHERKYEIREVAEVDGCRLQDTVR